MTTQIGEHDKGVGHSFSKYTGPGVREGDLGKSSDHEINSNRAEDKNEAVEGKLDARQTHKYGQEEPSQVDLARALGRLSINPDRDEYQRGRSTRRSKYVQEKKWFCFHCRFGPLD